MIEGYAWTYLTHWNLWKKLFSKLFTLYLSRILHGADSWHCLKSFSLGIVVTFSEVRKFTLYKTVSLGEMKIYLDNSYWVTLLQQDKGNVSHIILLSQGCSPWGHKELDTTERLNKWVKKLETREKPAMEKERWKASYSFINKLGQFLNNMLIEKFTHFSSNWTNYLSFS